MNLFLNHRDKRLTFKLSLTFNFKTENNLTFKQRQINLEAKKIKLSSQEQFKI